MTDNKKTLSGASIGYGFISSRGHLPAYGATTGNPAGVPQNPPAGEARLKIVAVADICAARREQAVKDLPGVRVYASHEELLAREAGRIDFVDITTPPAAHAEIAHAALDRGLHVLCEKPLTTTTAEARALLDHARRAKRVVFPCHNYKQAPVIRAVRRVLDAGTIGDVSLVTLHTFRNTHAKGVPEWKTDWRREKRYSGGGIAMDHGSHTFYLAFDWLGTFPTAVTAHMSTLGNWDTEDNLACSVTFPNGTASAHLSWTAGMRRVIYTLNGTRGAIRVEDDEMEIITSPAEGGGKWNTKRETFSSDWMDASHTIWFRAVLNNFADAIDAGIWAGHEAETSARCIELITTAYASAQNGSRVMGLGAGDAPKVSKTRDSEVAPLSAGGMA